ncbi:MAG: hypothetical protein IT371_15830 [Deltaproteobacteria bacterium]|nr:hypothetical protein [Deltaproteobacteria bacterium]
MGSRSSRSKKSKTGATPGFGRGRSTAEIRAAERKPSIWRRPLQVLAVLFALMIVWAMVTANARFPEPEELARVALELPKSPEASPPLLKLLDAKTKLYGQLPPEVEDARTSVSKLGRWPDAPVALLTVLNKMEPSLPSFRSALEAPGCLPLEAQSYTDEPARLSYLGMLRGVELLGLEAVALAQAGQATEAARHAHRVVDRLLAFEQRCAPDLVASMIVSSSITFSVRVMGFVLASPALDPAERVTLLERLRTLETRPSPMPHAMRWEHATFRQLVERDFRVPSQKRQAERLIWPWYDRAHTLMMVATLGRRRVWLAERPASAPELGQRFPEEEYFDQLSQTSRALNFVRYNATGKILVSIGVSGFRRYIASWHQRRCFIAAQRARWVRDLGERGAKLPEAVTRARPTNPFTEQPFLGTDGDLPCKIPAALDLVSDPGLAVFSLPRVPGAAAGVAPGAVPGPRPAGP